MLTQERLKELLRYNPDTGVFTRIKTGKEAGCLDGGYIVLNAGGKLHYAHRLAFLWMTGSLPPEYVDHINGVRSDNRWSNLRPATHAENCRNSRARKGLKGVFPRSNGTYRARVTFNGKKYNIGTYKTPELAHAAYCEKASELHGAFANTGV